MVKPLSNDKRGGLRRPKHLSLVDIAYQALVEGIVNQDFEPGSQINIEMLTGELNMSNTPVREALIRVAGEHFVRQESNKGFIVTNILNPQELKQMFDVRHLLEIYALQTSDIRAEDIETLENINNEANSAKEGLVYQEFKDFLHADHLLHRSIVELSRNEFLIKSWEDLNVHLHISRLYIGVGLFDRDQSSVEHGDIVQHLKDGNREKAMECLSKHIRDVEVRLSTFLANRQTK